MFYELNIDLPPFLECLNVHLHYLQNYHHVFMHLTVCTGAQQQQPAVFKVSESGGCRPLRV